MQKVEQILNNEKLSIIGNNAEKALAALEIREKLILKEAKDFGIGEIQCTEFSHRNEVDTCNFINNSFPDLKELVLSE